MQELQKLEDHNIFYPKKHILLNKRILIKVPKLSDKTEGGIYYGESTHAREQREVIKGILINWAEGAFEDWKIKPNKGDVVYFQLYAGRVLYDKDGNIYRNMSDKELTGFERK